VGFWTLLRHLKTQYFQMLAERPTYATRILDQTTRELYIPASQAKPLAGALSTPAGGAKSKEKRLFVRPPGSVRDF
jgi:hypothetical protein